MSILVLYPIVVLGIALSIFFYGRYRTKQPFLATAVYTVTMTDQELSCAYPDGSIKRIAWPELTRVQIKTTAEDLLEMDVLWGFYTKDNNLAVIVPSGATGEQEMLKALEEKLLGFDHAAVITAMGSPSHHTFDVWKKPAIEVPT